MTDKLYLIPGFSDDVTVPEEGVPVTILGVEVGRARPTELGLVVNLPTSEIVDLSLSITSVYRPRFTPPALYNITKENPNA